MRDLNRYDLLIIVTIASLAWGSFELLGALTPIRIIGAIGILYVVPRGGEIWPRYKSWIVLISLWWFYLIISMLWVPDIKESIISFFHITTMFGVFLLFFYLSLKCRKLLYSITLGWSVFLCITLPIAYWEITTFNHLSSGSFNDSGTGKIFAAVTFMNYNSYVVMLIYALSFIACAFLQKVKGKWFFVVQFFLALIVVLVNASRGGIMCSVIILLFLFLCTFKYTESKYLKSILIVLTVAIIALVIINIDSISIFQNIVSRMSGGGSFFNDSLRFAIWRRGFGSVMDNLFIGRGPGSMIPTFTYKTDSLFNYAHNYYLEMLIENGAVIAITYFVLIYKALMDLTKSGNVAVKFLGITIMVISVFLFIIDDYYTMRSGIWVFILCLIVLSSSDKSIDESFIHTS